MKKNYSRVLFLLILMTAVVTGKSYGQAGVGIPFGFTVGAPLAPALTNVAVAATGADESKFILAGAGFNMPFAGTSYPLVLASTNGWAALLPASDLSGLVTTTTNSVAVAANATTITLTSAFGVANGMYVSGTGIFGGNGYAQVLNVAGNVITINIGSTAVAIGAGTYNFYNLTAPAFFNTAVPGNSLSTYAAQRPMIAPLWDDLSTSVFSYSVTAAAVNIKWNCKWDKTNALATLTFILTLNNTGNITFSYPNVAYTVSGSPTASIGLAGICSGDYYSANPTSATTAVFDSTSEYSNITGVGANRLSNASITWNPFSPNDNCSGASHPAKDLGTINTSCTYTVGSNVNATTSGSNICATTDNKDVWYKFTKPAGTTNVLITTIAGTCQAAAGTTIEAFATCGGTSLGCATTSVGNPNFGELALTRPCASEVLYVRVTVDGDVLGKFQICVKDNGTAVTGGATCGAPAYICSLPYNGMGLTTAGSGNEYDSSNTVCHSLYGRGEDFIFEYTPTVSQCVRVSITSAGTSPGVFIYNNCPDSSGTGPTYCLGSAEGVTGTVTINSVTLTAGTTYYIMVDNQIAGGNIPFDIHVTSLGTANSYDNCATPFPLGSIGNGQSCVFQTLSTECSTPSPVGGGYPVPSCINASAVPRTFIDGVTGDVWLSFTSAFATAGVLQISTQQGSSNPTANAAMAVYTGSCGAFTQFACDYNSGPNGMPLLSVPISTTPTTYYIRIWSENPESQGTFDICLQSACAPPNDLPCGAVMLPLGGTTTGFNTCTGAAAEPPNAAQCSAGGTINTVWYKTIVPASGQVHIRTHPLTLTDTQIQAFTFSAGCTNAASSYTSRGCNDDGPGCSGGFSDFSDLLVTGLTPNDTLYIAVDGFNSQTGSFEITMIDGTTPSFPPVYQQDCAAAQVLCSTSSVTVADPGFRNYGNICDRGGATGCWGVGERNSIWYQFTVDPALAGGTANLTFDILSQSSTDIDVLVWDITGQAAPCASITSGALAPAQCNYGASSASTGLTTTLPLPYAYSSAITFTGAPRTFMVLLNNWNSAANAGYTLNWGSTPISTAASTAIWTGLTDALFSTTTNWGDCGGTPACGIDAIVNPTANGRQPSVIGSQGVKNITINAGATLTLAAGATLNVCGSFTNYGTLVCNAGSTINFIGATAQIIAGNLTGTNAFANLSVLKSANSVTLNTNIDVKENFSTLSATSIFDIGGKYMKVAGNFTNNTSTTTFTGVGGSTVEFNGTTNQFFTNVNNVAGVTMNRVIMNKASGKLYLNNANSTLNIDSVLTLTSGILSTRAFPTIQVFVKYGVTAAVVGHSAISYIDGKLRRAVYTGSPLTLPFLLDFPVGDTLAIGGYELASVTFTSGTVIPDLQGTFTWWTNQGAPPLGPIATECMIANYNPNPLFNHGYWTFSKTSASPFNGIYKLGMNNLGQTNNTGYNGWTIAKADIASDPNLTASWSLIGQCVSASTALSTQRININGTNPYTLTTTIGSNIITTGFSGVLYGTTNMSVGATVTGPGIPGGSVITAILNAGAFTISNPATATGTVAGSVGSTAASGTSFNHHYSIAQSTVPLPIELISFTAEPEKDYVVCNWTTATETNNDYFEVLRSFNGTEFKVIGNVKGFGAGSSTTNRSYSFVDDEEKCNSVRYYQLRQVDIDNKSTLTDIVAVNCKNNDETVIIYPNPASETLTYQFFQNGEDVIEVRIVDMTGREVSKELLNAQRGFNTTTMSIENFASGVYSLQIRSVNSSSSTAPRITQFFKK